MAGIEELLRRRRELLEEIDGEIRSSYQKPATLLFTDIVGSTEFFEAAGDIAGRQMIQTHNDLLFPLIASHGGTVIKTIGDSIMARFEDPVEGTRCAVRMQEALARFNGSRPEPERIRVRMGLHYGSAVMEERDLFGDMVNAAARVESRAQGEEILISGSLAAQLKDSGIPLIFLGSDTVKGKKQKIDFYLVNWSGRSEEEVQASWARRSAAAPAVSSPATAAPAQGAVQAPGVRRQRVMFRGLPDVAAEAAAIKPLSRKGNPYLNRVMIPHPEMFFGREPVVKRILNRLAAERPQSVSVVGERRIGKSSLLNYLRSPVTRLRVLEEPERSLFLFLDFQQLRTIDESQFLAFLFAELAKQLGQVVELDLEEDFEGLRFLCDRITSQGCRLILLMDEFESVTKNERIGAPFYSLLRSLANNFAVAFLTASGRNLKDMCVSHQIADSPFFNIFAAQHLSLFRPEEALALIREPSAARGVPLEPLAGKILSMGGLYPFFVQIASAAWFEFLEAEGKPAEEYAGRDVPAEVLSAFREEAEPHFEFVLQTLPPEESSCLKKALKGEAPEAAPAESLARKGYLVCSTGGAYEPFSAEFRRFAESFFARAQS